MKTAIQDLLTANFEGMGEDATYTPLNGDPAFALKIFPSLPDDQVGYSDAIVLVPTFVCEFLKSAVPAPVKGDRITYDSIIYRIEEEPESLDRLALVWSVSTRRV